MFRMSCSWCIACLVQNDIKRVIAYSTCSQLGYMFVALGVGAYAAGDRRATMKTPAVTMVAAWMSAETGVGPSIASGSQLRPVRRDLVRCDLRQGAGAQGRDLPPARLRLERP
jgi:hypothetical protein